MAHSDTTNLTINVKPDTLRRARIRALQEGTSVSAVLREFLDRWTDGAPPDDTGEALVALARQSTAGSGPGGRTWTRDALHER